MFRYCQICRLKRGSGNPEKHVIHRIYTFASNSKIILKGQLWGIKKGADAPFNRIIQKL
jgi:hypothetical protein